VVASAPSSLFQQPRYRGTSGSWHVAMRRLQARAWLLAFALMGGGCSVSYQLHAPLANTDAGAAAEADSPRAATPKATAEMPAETDLAIARAAVSEVLIKGGKYSSVPWENPKTFPLAAPSAASGKCAICGLGTTPRAAPSRYTLTAVMIPSGKISSGAAWRCAIPCSRV